MQRKAGPAAIRCWREADFRIGGEGRLDKPLRVAIAAKDRATVDALYQAAMAAGERDMCSTPTGTPSKPSVTRRVESAPSATAMELRADLVVVAPDAETFGSRNAD